MDGRPQVEHFFEVAFVLHRQEPEQRDVVQVAVRKVGRGCIEPQVLAPLLLLAPLYRDCVEPRLAFRAVNVVYGHPRCR